MIHTPDYFAILEVLSAKFTKHKHSFMSISKIKLKQKRWQHPYWKDLLRQKLAFMKVLKSDVKRMTWRRKDKYRERSSNHWEQTAISGDAWSAETVKLKCEQKGLVPLLASQVRSSTAVRGHLEATAVKI